jgi:hypothetical protein
MWLNDTYIYSPGWLKTIAANYEHIYQGISLINGELLNETQALIEFKSDFDRALDELGRGDWYGEIDKPYQWYKYHGKLQRVVIADIYGIPDCELEREFYSIPRLKGFAYRRMSNILNGIKRPPADSVPRP